MRSLPIALLLLLGMASSPALAQSGGTVADASAEPTAPAASDAPEEDDSEIIVEGEVPKERRRVCEVQTTTGSIMPKRVCRTVAQIEEDERVARESMEIMKRDHDTRSYVELSRRQGT